jgi:hypothetical protein
MLFADLFSHQNIEFNTSQVSAIFLRYLSQLLKFIWRTQIWFQCIMSGNWRLKSNIVILMLFNKGCVIKSQLPKSNWA